MTEKEMLAELMREAKLKAEKRVDTVLTLASRDMENDENSPYWSVDQNDQCLLSRLRQLAVSRDLTLADLDVVIKEEWEATCERMEVMWEKHARMRVVLPRKCRVYNVYNTADKPLKVLAIDVASARMHAIQNRHIQEEKNGRIVVYNEEWHEREMKSGSALGRAIIAGYQGVLKKVGNNIVIEPHGKVFIPLSVVND